MDANRANRMILERCGFFSRDRVQAVVSKSTLPSPEEVRRITVTSLGKCNRGCGGLPDFAVQIMYEDYLRLGSTRKVGKKYGRTRQSIWKLFRSRGFKMSDRNFHPKILYGGREWTPMKGGYYRPTKGDRSLHLHHQMWMDRTGRKVSEGWQVTFKNGDQTDFSQGNLVCMPLREVVLHHYRRRYPDRAHMTPEQLEEFWRVHNRDYMRRKAMARKEQRRMAA